MENYEASVRISEKPEVEEYIQSPARHEERRPFEMALAGQSNSKISRSSMPFKVHRDSEDYVVPFRTSQPHTMSNVTPAMSDGGGDASSRKQSAHASQLSQISQR